MIVFGTEAHGRCNPIFIKYTNGSVLVVVAIFVSEDLLSSWLAGKSVDVLCERECVESLEPALVGASAIFTATKQKFHRIHHSMVEMAGVGERVTK